MPRLDKICELGVCRGEHAQRMLTHHDPEELHLIDAWSSETLMDSYCVLDTQLDFVSDLQTFTVAFGGDPEHQSTMDAALAETRSRFAGDKRVSIVKEKTHTAVHRYPQAYFDLIYIDASHQYPNVQRDLYLWADKLKPAGFLVLNDCASSPKGRQQNLGVLEAASNFVKATAFRPLALSSGSFADLILTRSPDSWQASHFRQGIIGAANLAVVELPDESLFGFNHKLVTVSIDGQERTAVLPSFKI